MSKREFWLAAPEFGDYDYCETMISKDRECVKTEDDFKFNAIHVIEYSAYSDLQRRFDELEQIADSLNHELDARNFQEPTASSVKALRDFQSFRAILGESK